MTRVSDDPTDKAISTAILLPLYQTAIDPAEIAVSAAAADVLPACLVTARAWPFMCPLRIHDAESVVTGMVLRFRTLYTSWQATRRRASLVSTSLLTRYGRDLPS